ncbi:MAG: hypothetical protein AAB958_00150 [Patescibacteria group bacterium]
MILIINICKEKLHYYEFIKPIKDILDKNNVDFLIKHYKNIKKEDLQKSDKIIICGTSLMDNEFIKYTNKFNWIKNFNKPVLGICGGMEIIGLAFCGKLKRKTEIGFYEEKFNKQFLGLKNIQKVYHLHNYYINFNNINEFGIFCSSGKISQAVKHNQKQIYGVLFHPEVRQKELITNFLN